MERQDIEVKDLEKYLSQYPDQVQVFLSVFSADDIYKQLATREGGEFYSAKEIIEREAHLDFPAALLFLKDGYKLARSGWNGKGMFIYLVQGTEVEAYDLLNEAAEHLGLLYEDWDKVKINSHIDMKAADGSIVVGWSPSQTDLLAQDWVIVK